MSVEFFIFSSSHFITRINPRFDSFQLRKDLVPRRGTPRARQNVFEHDKAVPVEEGFCILIRIGIVPCVCFVRPAFRRYVERGYEPVWIGGRKINRRVFHNRGGVSFRPRFPFIKHLNPNLKPGTSFLPSPHGTRWELVIRSAFQFLQSLSSRT
jgi:hypothetical protein